MKVIAKNIFAMINLSKLPQGLSLPENSKDGITAVFESIADLRNLTPHPPDVGQNIRVRGPVPRPSRAP
jgi:hypothetical protein